MSIFNEDNFVAQDVANNIKVMDRVIFGNKILPVIFIKTTTQINKQFSLGIKGDEAVCYVVVERGANKYVGSLAKDIPDYIIEPVELAFISHRINPHINYNTIVKGLGGHEVRHRIQKEGLVDEFFTFENSSSNWYLGRLWYFLKILFKKYETKEADLDREFDATVVEFLIMHHLRINNFSEKKLRELLLITPSQLLKVQPGLLTQ